MFLKRYWLPLGALLVFVLFVACVHIANRSHPAILPIIAVEGTDSGVNLIGSGSAVLIDNKRGYIVTAKHVARAFPDNASIVMKVIVNGHEYPLTLVWEGKTADIAVMQLGDEALHDLSRIPPIRVRSFAPTLNEKVRAIGWTDPVLRSGEDCIITVRQNFCQSQLGLKIGMIDVSMQKIASGTAAQELRIYSQKAKEHNGMLAFADVFYTTYLVAIPRTSVFDWVVWGMSGGALLDEQDELLGITSSTTLTMNVFIPAREIPKEYLSQTP